MHITHYNFAIIKELTVSTYPTIESLNDATRGVFLRSRPDLLAGRGCDGWLVAFSVVVFLLSIINYVKRLTAKLGPIIIQCIRRLDKLRVVVIHNIT